MAVMKSSMNNPFELSISAPVSAVSPNPYDASVSIGSGYNVTLPPSRNETAILEKAKPHLYQSSEVVDMVMWEDAQDEETLKATIRERLSRQMAKHLTENMSFTRVNDHSNNNMTIHGRCYAFTREQLLDFCREINK